MPEKIVQLNEAVIKNELKELVRGSVEKTLNELLEAEANKLTQAARYERNEQRQGYRSGHYNRKKTRTAGSISSSGYVVNVFSVTPRSKVKLVAKMLKAIHAQESKKAARDKARAVVNHETERSSQEGREWH